MSPKKRRPRHHHKPGRDQDPAAIQRRREHLAEQDAPAHLNPDELVTDCDPNGLVVSPYGLLAFVKWEGEEDVCRIVPRLTDGKKSFLAPGDRVRVELVEDEPTITEVAPRRNKLGRPKTGQDREQVFAANIDLLVIVASTKKPYFKPGLVDRFLIAAENGGVKSALCVNKMDLVDDPPPEAKAYEDIGLDVVYTSCETERGLDTLRELLQGKTSVLAGHSGVGKSSIVNALHPTLDLATQEVSTQTDKGKHTTTSSRLYELDESTKIIDTPGIKQLGLWGVSKEEVPQYFPEIADLATQCKFRNCTHQHEPGCAVLEALEAGNIAQHRYDSYLRIRQSLEEQESY